MGLRELEENLRRFRPDLAIVDDCEDESSIRSELETSRIVKLINEANKDLDAKRAKLLDDLLTEIRTKIKDFAVKEKYDLILNYQSQDQVVVFSPESSDVTGAVIQFLNASKPK